MLVGMPNASTAVCRLRRLWPFAAHCPGAQPSSGFQFPRHGDRRPRSPLRHHAMPTQGRKHSPRSTGHGALSDWAMARIPGLGCVCCGDEGGQQILSDHLIRLINPITAVRQVLGRGPSALEAFNNTTKTWRTHGSSPVARVRAGGAAGLLAGRPSGRKKTQRRKLWREERAVSAVGNHRGLVSCLLAMDGSRLVRDSAMVHHVRRVGGSFGSGGGRGPKRTFLSQA